MLRPIYAKVIGIIAVIVAVLLVGVLFETRMSIHEAREQVLSDGLATTRAVINQYTIDKNHRPRSLEDLFAAVRHSRHPQRVKKDWQLTPAMEAGLTYHVWSVPELLACAE